MRCSLTEPKTNKKKIVTQPILLWASQVFDCVLAFAITGTSEMKSLFSLAHVSQWWSLECRATPPSKNTSSRPLHRQCFWITILCNSAPLSFLYLIIKKICVGENIFTFYSLLLAEMVISHRISAPCWEVVRALLEAWIQSLRLSKKVKWPMFHFIWLSNDHLVFCFP